MYLVNILFLLEFVDYLTPSKTRGYWNPLKDSIVQLSNTHT